MLWCCDAVVLQKRVAAFRADRDLVRDSVFVESFTVKTAVFVESLGSLPACNF